MQNRMVESVNGKIRDEFLNENGFLNRASARKEPEQFKKNDNTAREQSSSGRLVPAKFKGKVEQTPSGQVG